MLKIGSHKPQLEKHCDLVREATGLLGGRVRWSPRAAQEGTSLDIISPSLSQGTCLCFQ